MSESDAKNQTAVNSLDSLRSYVEGYPLGGRMSAMNTSGTNWH